MGHTEANGTIRRSDDRRADRSGRHPRRGLPPVEARVLRYLLDPEGERRERCEDLLERLTLSSAEHASIEEGCNVMEAVSYLAGEPWSSTPRCVSPRIALFLRRWNDDLPSDELRNRLLKPLIPTVLDTSRDPRHEQLRAWMCVDWLVREYTASFLLLAGFDEQAKRLEKLGCLRSEEVERKAQSLLADALERVEQILRRDANNVNSYLSVGTVASVVGGVTWVNLFAIKSAAWSVARSAAGNAARVAAESFVATLAWGAASKAVELTAISSAGQDVRSDVLHAVRDILASPSPRDDATNVVRKGAWGIARETASKRVAESLQPLVDRLQDSAVELAGRMAAVGR
jgi:hypothetical protein